MPHPQLLFTFHYASTLSPPRQPCDPVIYNLHSTMLLLYRIPPAVMASWILFIYIPLCFYFILPSSPKIVYNTPFTFHYASTLSEIGSRGGVHFHNLHSTMLLLYLYAILTKGVDYEFTFHYASTLSGKAYCTACGKTNLHSTMLLLYLSAFSSAVTMVPIYIPLCFYFIRMLFGCRIRSFYLHSTMLLLYPILQTKSVSPYLYLHSTMLLLYRLCGI